MSYVLFTGNRIGYIRNDEWRTQPTPEQARGLKRSRQGNLRLYHDASGQLQLAYSYNACIFTRLPSGRPVLNITRYGSTTARHVSRIYSAWACVPHCEAGDMSPMCGAADLIEAIRRRGADVATLAAEFVAEK